MTTFENIWRKLATNKKYREEFALSFLKRAVAFQVKTLRKKYCGSQAVLAERSNLTQGVVSRAEDQDYGNLTFNTVGRIAAGLDMAFIGRFVPFSELVKFSLELSEEQFTSIAAFDQENANNIAALAMRFALSNPFIEGKQPQRETQQRPLPSINDYLSRGRSELKPQQDSTLERIAPAIAGGEVQNENSLSAAS